MSNDIAKKKEGCCDLCHEVVETKLYRKTHRICVNCMKVFAEIFGDTSATKIITIDWPATKTTARKGNQHREHYNLQIECKKCGGLMFANHVQKWKVLNKLTNIIRSPLRRFVVPLHCAKCDSWVQLFMLGYVNEYIYVNDEEIKLKDYYREERIREGTDLRTNLRDAYQSQIEAEEENKKLRQEIEKLKKQRLE